MTEVDMAERDYEAMWRELEGWVAKGRMLTDESKRDRWGDGYSAAFRAVEERMESIKRDAR